MNIEQIEAVVEDRGILLNCIKDIMELAINDHGITRTAMMSIQGVYIKALKQLKYDQSIETVERSNG